MKSAFIITSALNTRFGIYTPEQRLQQTIATIQSIKKNVPDAKLIAVELAGVAPTDEQRAIMNEHLDVYIDLSADSDVTAIYNSTDNWDIVKSTTEVLGFSRALQRLLDTNELDDIDRIFKISGRYTISDDFNIQQFEQLPGRIIVSRQRSSQFGPRITGGISRQYMSRLWSWPADKSQTVVDIYHEGLVFMAQVFSNGGYCDIEHMLFKFLPQDFVTEVACIGVEGNVAPNGISVKD